VTDPNASLFVTVVLDGVGVGAQPDAAEYGEAECNTLGNLAEKRPMRLPILQALGLGHIRPIAGVPPVLRPRAAYGRMAAQSAGMDSTSGHWELAGLQLATPFPTYPDGLPHELLEAFARAVGADGVLGGEPISGTDVIARYGAEHQATGKPIVYTSADSVFQIAVHVDTVPVETLYRWCRIAREQVCTGEHAAGRVIARPFSGSEGAYERLEAQRRDFALPPPRPALPQVLQRNGVQTVAVGKIYDLFAGVGFNRAHKTSDNTDGIEQTLQAMEAARGMNRPTFIWTNLVDFDSKYGHRNDVEGFASALEAFDTVLPRLVAALPKGGRLLITADHGNDPTTPSTDHNREYVPVLYYGDGNPRDLGLRPTFADHAATVAHYFGIEMAAGTPF
jgi:phosphopentomutase